ncbi:hypothetical protein M413DRAFT_441746 [Hebeloma cylindrosporum]|uniref:Uncharacterized protein n=1 Tax=Hebeloma cylindrosporum TaxID=76867 RepID=A0A0C2YVS7_HEBCY|nr:hypothetical protein M413DRAFT_441746 [Hebeloma cylindrosporum h7]
MTGPMTATYFVSSAQHFSIHQKGTTRRVMAKKQSNIASRSSTKSCDHRLIVFARG